MRRGLYRSANGRLEERQAWGTVAQFAEELRESGVRLLACAGGRFGGRNEGVGADLENQARNSEPSAGTNRSGARLGDRSRLPQGRKPSTLARPSQQAALAAVEDTESRALPRPSP